MELKIGSETIQIAEGKDPEIAEGLYKLFHWQQNSTDGQRHLD